MENTPEIAPPTVNKTVGEINGILEKAKKKLQNLQNRIAFIELYRAAFEEAGVTPHIFDGYCQDETYIDFNFLTHAETVAVIRAVGGKFKKDYKEGKIDYTTKIDDFTVRIYNGQPPPSCKLVEYEVEVPAKIIPARTEKKFKLECQTPLRSSVNFSTRQRNNPQTVRK